MNLKQIKELVDVLDNSSLTEIDINDKDFKLTLKKILNKKSFIAKEQQMSLQNNHNKQLNQHHNKMLNKKHQVV